MPRPDAYRRPLNESLAIFTKHGIFTAAMNMDELVKIEGPFEADALRILRTIPEITAIRRESSDATGQIDAVLHFNGKRTPIVVKFKTRANAATAWQLVQNSHLHPNTRMLLIANQSTAEAREILARHRIGVVDGLGNVRIKMPGLILRLEGRNRPDRAAEQRPPTRLHGKAGLIGEALLINPNRAWGVQDIALEARVSAGLAHRVLARLENEGILATEGTGPNRMRRVANPTALLDLWAEENREKPTRTLGHILAQTPGQLLRELGTNLARHRIEYAITGAAAGSLLAPFVTAVPIVDVWAAELFAPADICKGANAERVTEGYNVVFLQTKADVPLVFRQTINSLRVVSSFRVYADLRRDPRRGAEQAEHLRKEVIRF